MPKKIIKKLDIKLLKDKEIVEEAYTKARNKYIAEYSEYQRGHSTGLFGWKDGEDVKRPDVGSAKWDEAYPKGITSWEIQNFHSKLTPYGQQNLVDKINEIIEFLNKK